MVCQVRNHENATKKLDGGFASGIHGIGVARSPVRTFTSRPGHFAVSRGLDTIGRHLRHYNPWLRHRLGMKAPNTGSKRTRNSRWKSSSKPDGKFRKRLKTLSSVRSFRVQFAVPDQQSPLTSSRGLFKGWLTL